METGKDVKTIEVGIGKYEIGEGDALLITRNLGSCIGASLYARKARTGALLHVKLPENPVRAGGGMDDGSPEQKDLLIAYVDTAVPVVLAQLEKKGIFAGDLEAKIAGGAKMFPVPAGMVDLGRQNMEAMKRVLGLYRIPIIGEDTGGSHGRTMELDARDGSVRVYSFSKEEKQL